MIKYLVMFFVEINKNVIKTYDKNSEKCKTVISMKVTTTSKLLLSVISGFTWQGGYTLALAGGLNLLDKRVDPGC